MLLAEVSNPPPVRLERSRGVVGRTIVADDYLEWGQRLRERRLNRLGDRRGGVVRRNHDGEVGTGPGSTSAIRGGTRKTRRPVPAITC